MTLNQAGCEVKITEQAAKEFTSMCEDENKLLESSYLRVGANSGGCSGWKYSLDFEDSIDSEDLTFMQYGVTIVVDKKSHIVIDGLEIEWSTDLSAPGPRFQNPRAASTCGCSTSFSIKSLEFENPVWMKN